jgi:polysaccharide biosynthesis transport protein
MNSPKTASGWLATRAVRPLQPAAEWSISSTSPPSQLLEYLRLIRANLARIGLQAVIGMVVGWLFATHQQPLYEARTVLDIRTLNENFLNPREGSSSRTSDSILPEAYIQTEIKILQSDSIRDRALSKLSLPTPLPMRPAEGGFWDVVLGFVRPRPISYGDLVADAGQRIKVRAIGNTRIVDLLCDAQDGQLAASLCNTLARTYIENNLESRVKSTKETSDWLQSQLDDVRRRLTKAENDLKDAAKVTDLGFTSQGVGSPAQDRLRELQAELSRSQAERIIRESNFSVVAERDPYSLPLEMDSGPIREYRLKLEDLRRQLNEMKATMTPEHYRVREITMQIAEVEKALNSERDGLVNRLKADLEAARHREQMISTAYDKETARASRSDDQAVHYNMLKHEVDSERQLYETLLQKVGEVGLTAALRTSAISIVDPATAPLKPYSPKKLASVGIGFFGGSAIGLAFSLIRARADRTLRFPGEAASYLNVRELGIIPTVRGRGLRMRLMGVSPDCFLDQMPATGDTQHSRPAVSEVLMNRMPVRSVALAAWLGIPEMSEAFAGTMNSLLLGERGSASAQMIVITSPEEGDGKTTVAANLAIALAQIGRRVVLVDGDLRKPRLHTIFNVSAEKGVAKLLDATDQIGQQPLDQLVSKTQIPNLYIIPTKPVHHGVSKRLHSLGMRTLLARLRGEFEMVIIDSPPMRDLSDARVLGWLADGVVLVLRARKTTSESAVAVSECLLQDGIRVLGTVLNDWAPRKAERYRAYSPNFRLA